MSAEHLSPEQRLTNRLIVDIPWPTRAFPNDLAQIDEYRRDGSTLFASFADVIADEAAELNRGLVKAAAPPESVRTETSLYLSGGMDFYVKPSLAIWAADEVVRNGSLDSEFLDDLMQRSSTMYRLSRGLDWLAPELAKLGKDLSVAAEDIQSLTEPEVHTTMADWPVTADALSRMLFAGSTPLEVVDLYTNAQLEQLPQTHHLMLDLQRAALEAGRRRFHELYRAVMKAEHPEIPEEVGGLEEVSGSTAVDIVEKFLQSLSSQKEDEARRVLELHERMKRVGELSEAFVPHLRIDEEDIASNAELDLFPSGLTEEEAGNMGIDSIGRITQFEGGLQEGEIRIDIDDGLGSLVPNVGVTFFHNPENNPNAPLVGTSHINQLGFSNRDHLTISLHMDLQTAPQVGAIQRLRGRRSSSFIKTTYFFDAMGKYVKSSEIPKEVKDDRTPINPIGGTKMLLSEMTEEDFNIVTEALTRIEEVLSENLQLIEGEKRERGQ